MPNPRLPVAKAKALGADERSPGRHADRTEVKTTDLGEASDFLDDFEKRAWEGFKKELPWLTESDRAVLEVACKVRGRLIEGETPGVTALSMLQAILSKLGATPADRSRINASDDTEPDEFFDN